MHKTDHSDFSPPAVGGASLLVVFAVLCLTVFALLSLTTVQANARLSIASAQTVSDYYAADCAAQDVLARLRLGDIPSEVRYENGVYAYECSISDTQTLAVEVRLENGNFTVLRWEALATGEWDVDESLHAWDGAEF